MFRQGLMTVSLTLNITVWHWKRQEIFCVVHIMFAIQVHWIVLFETPCNHIKKNLFLENTFSRKDIDYIYLKLWMNCYLMCLQIYVRKKMETYLKSQIHCINKEKCLLISTPLFPTRNCHQKKKKPKQPYSFLWYVQHVRNSEILLVQQATYSKKFKSPCFNY